ncbi:type VI secretion system lipoprotein TssJ [Desulfonatronum sp. SC1]|nr:type VI secretion system lipoprotein TssJ [Desulfonatronum sp. SC1]
MRAVMKNFIQGCGFMVHGSRFTVPSARSQFNAARSLPPLRPSTPSLQLSALFLLLLFFLSACHGYPPPGKKPPPKPWETLQNAASPDQVKWTYLPGGLTLNLKADKDLNLFEGFSHNILLCTYQMSSPAAFQELAANLGGIRKLLECARFDQSVVHVERRFISPGQESTFVLDRAEGAQHIGLAAGYNDLQPGLVTTLYSFPVVTGRDGWWPWSSDVYNPGTLTMDILLGPNSIQRMGVE